MPEARRDYDHPVMAECEQTTTLKWSFASIEHTALRIAINYPIHASAQLDNIQKSCVALQHAKERTRNNRFSAPRIDRSSSREPEPRRPDRDGTI